MNPLGLRTFLPTFAAYPAPTNETTGFAFGNFSRPAPLFADAQDSLATLVGQSASPPTSLFAPVPEGFKSRIDLGGGPIDVEVVDGSTRDGLGFSQDLRRLLSETETKPSSGIHGDAASLLMAPASANTRRIIRKQLSDPELADIISAEVLLTRRGILLVFDVYEDGALQRSFAAPEHQRLRGNLGAMPQGSAWETCARLAKSLWAGFVDRPVHDDTTSNLSTLDAVLSRHAAFASPENLRVLLQRIAEGEPRERVLTELEALAPLDPGHAGLSPRAAVRERVREKLVVAPPVVTPPPEPICSASSASDPLIERIRELAPSLSEETTIDEAIVTVLKIRTQLLSEFTDLSFIVIARAASQAAGGQLSPVHLSDHTRAGIRLIGDWPEEFAFYKKLAELPSLNPSGGPSERRILVSQRFPEFSNTRLTAYVRVAALLWTHREELGLTEPAPEKQAPPPPQEAGEKQTIRDHLAQVSDGFSDRTTEDQLFDMARVTLALGWPLPRIGIVAKTAWPLLGVSKSLETHAYAAKVLVEDWTRVKEFVFRSEGLAKPEQIALLKTAFPTKTLSALIAYQRAASCLRQHHAELGLEGPSVEKDKNPLQKTLLELVPDLPTVSSKDDLLTRLLRIHPQLKGRFPHLTATALTAAVCEVSDYRGNDVLLTKRMSFGLKLIEQWSAHSAAFKRCFDPDIADAEKKQRVAAHFSQGRKKPFQQAQLHEITATCNAVWKHRAELGLPEPAEEAAPVTPVAPTLPTDKDIEEFFSNCVVGSPDLRAISRWYLQNESFLKEPEKRRAVFDLVGRAIIDPGKNPRTLLAALEALKTSPLQSTVESAEAPATADAIDATLFRLTRTNPRQPGWRDLSRWFLETKTQLGPAALSSLDAALSAEAPDPKTILERMKSFKP